MAAGNQTHIPDLTQLKFYAEYQTPQQMPCFGNDCILCRNE